MVAGRTTEHSVGADASQLRGASSCENVTRSLVFSGQDKNLDF